MTDLTHFDIGDIDRRLRAAEGGDERAKEIIARNAHDWLKLLLATVANDRAAIRRLEAVRVAPAPAPEPRWRERLIARLMEALRPFARWSFEWPNTQDEITVAGHAMVTVGDLRRAQAALDHASQVAREDRGARVSERPAPDYKKMLEDLAEAAVGYLNAQAHVGVTKDDLRRLNYQLGCLAGPHLKAYTAGSPPQTESTEP